MRKKKNILLSLFVLLTSYFLVFEVAARLVVKEGEDFYGTLFGVELPPYELVSPAATPEIRDRSEWYENLLVDGRRITVGDLWGYYREDPLLGFAPLENTRSISGWWQSNSIGAMARYEISPSMQKDIVRILVFGESFAMGSRVPQEMAWPSILGSRKDSIEVINLAVDGYSMAQSYLRYGQIKNRLDFDLVLLMFVPGEDLWRDINIRRDLRDWPLYWMIPRFILEEDRLKLISYPVIGDLRYTASDLDTSDGEFISLLKEYDRFYFPAKYEKPWLVGDLILYKLIARVIYELQTNRVTASLLTPNSEALQVTQKIFETMADDVERDQGEFALIILPTPNDLQRFKQDADYKEGWAKMVATTCSRVDCIDLSNYLSDVSEDQLDRGYDGTHYGPNANGLIAQFIYEHLVNSDMLGS